MPALILSIIWIHYVTYLVLPKYHGCQSRMVCLKHQMKWSYCSCGFFKLICGFLLFLSLVSHLLLLKTIKCWRLFSQLKLAILEKKYSVINILKYRYQNTIDIMINIIHIILFFFILVSISKLILKQTYMNHFCEVYITHSKTNKFNRMI